MEDTTSCELNGHVLETESGAELIECIRRGEMDAVLGTGPLAGEILILKTHQLEEENRCLIEALQAEKEGLEEFAFATAHDLRGPLADMEGEIGMLLDQYARLRLPLWFVDSLRQIEHAAARMRLLVTDLLLLGEVGSQADAPQRVALFDVVASVLDGHRQQLTRSGVHVEIVDALPVLRGRLRHVEAIFDNLIDNAVRYAGTVAKGKVRIGCRHGDDELIVWVSDNGPGFDPREAEAVFEPYVRLDRSGDNTGLGLAIVRNAIRAHGGRTWIETEPSKGATACVAFPLTCLRDGPAAVPAS